MNSSPSHQSPVVSRQLHVAIIPDGNRRWAKTKGLLPWNGHERAIENFRSVLEWCRTDGRIGTLTIWCFSTENWKRDPKEVAELMRIYETFLRHERADFMKNNTRMVHSGRLDRIPKSLATLITDIAEETKVNDGYTFHIALDYGGKDEIVRAIRKIASHQVSEEQFRNFLDHPELPDIDLIIRTSGEMRTSNFFLWQSTYSEWMFLEKHFPEFSAKDMMKALEELEKRKRRFGS